MTVVDSSVWIARLSETDNQHAQAERVFEELEGSRVLVPEYIAIEVCTILARREGKDKADVFIDMVRDNEDIEYYGAGLSFFHEVLRLFRVRGDDKLSFTDVALLHLSKEFSVVTFDRALQKALEAE